MYLVQHGFQRGSKITDAMAAGTIDGVIWGPSDESPAALDAAIRDLQLTDLVQAIDPQIYVSTITDANAKKLRDYAHFDRNLQASDFTARRTIALVDECLDFQQALPVDVIIAPTVPVDAVGGRWAQIALELAQATIDEWGSRDDERDVFVSIACTRSLLANEEEVNGLLDDVTVLDCAGFYVLYEIDPGLGPPRHDELLERALWITYSLSALNDYRVWVGYAGLSGYSHRAAGAEAFCAGWWQKLQWWSPDHWLGGGGGRAPRPRVALDSVLGSLLIEELAAIRQSDRGLYDELVAGEGPLAEALRDTAPARLDPTRDEQAAQLFAICAELDGRLNGTTRDKILRALEDVDAATLLHRRIQRQGIALDSRSRGAHLASWTAALEAVGVRAELDL